jgi:hypothetical protein
MYQRRRQVCETDLDPSPQDRRERNPQFRNHTRENQGSVIKTILSSMPTSSTVGFAIHIHRIRGSKETDGNMTEPSSNRTTARDTEANISLEYAECR